MTKIFVTRRIPNEGLDLLTDTFGAEAVTVAPQDTSISRDVLLEAVQGADALLPLLTEAIDDELFDAAGPQLKVVANYAVGFNNIDVAAATKRGIAVSNTPGVLTDTTADLAWTLLMAAARRSGEAERYLRAGKWDSWGPMLMLGQDIHHATLGIFGMGRIGQAMAKRALGFDMKVIYHDIQRIPEDQEKALNATYVDKETLLKESDFLSLHCLLIPETRHAIDWDAFKLMKNSAVLINSARGPVVDEAALAKALQEGEIFSAGLDVFEEEPAIHPELLKCENVVALPHIASASLNTRGRMARIAAENIVAVLNGDQAPTCVNPEIYSQ